MTVPFVCPLFSCEVHQPPGTPCANGRRGMPSGHALNFFSAAAFLGLALRRRALTAALFAIAALVALSRVYLGVHYPSQALAGAALGAALGLIAAWLARRYLSFVQRLGGQGAAG